MRHPDSFTTRWGPIWFGKYALIFGAPLIFLVLAFHELEIWFLGLSLYWFCSVAFFAWRAVNKNVRAIWRIALAVLMLSSWSYAALLVYAEPGDTRICYDRIELTARWGPMINRGADPTCVGVALQNIQTD
ncbi:hypothetical protein AMC99_01613 [Altererythrobacter epoxidivorans]|uniref:Uncharacterized protein n=1 Tax=Altererythrobacter epoxidivorans TaxID=361183 RepID=A0A0M4LV19_9SPHN|nr:hypothetical protein [Altererythrobacter epoxidivorans]ALE16904.1 hypothetical protein AMC99_01613 [Altererythrobacter epoxidivorans]